MARPWRRLAPRLLELVSYSTGRPPRESSRPRTPSRRHTPRATAGAGRRAHGHARPPRTQYCADADGACSSACALVLGAAQHLSGPPPAPGAVSARRVTCASVPLIVQPQSERVVSAGTSARMNSWPLCLHARGPHAGHTQTRAHASRCVTVERASTGVCVHHARVSWISKQPGVVCPS